MLPTATSERCTGGPTVAGPAGFTGTMVLIRTQRTRWSSQALHQDLLSTMSSQELLMVLPTP